MKKISLLLAILLGTLMFAASLGAALDAERDALIALYNSTDGPNWSNNSGWGVGDPCDPAWYGVACEAGHVTELVLQSNALIGPIPAVLGNLSSLQRLNLAHNQLSGPIPAEDNRGRVLELLGAPDTFRLTFQELEGTVVRWEEWAYYDLGARFDFVDGQLVWTVELETPEGFVISLVDGDVQLGFAR